MGENEERDGKSFARRFRPTSLKGYIGNKDIKTSLRDSLRNKSYPQVMLLQGNSGCGKTTLSRIIGKEYCCENSGEDGACCVCPTCLAFDDYIKSGVPEGLPDVYEIDASKSSGKKDMDSMLSSIEYPAMSGSWKVYILDEVHLISEAAEGRLLKTLEEPPEGVLIILCTTNPEKLVNTVRNRCQRKYTVSKPTTKEIMDLLQHVCLAEDRNYDLAGLRMLVSRADNVVRDSLNYLEGVLSSKGDATAVSVSEEFKQISDSVLFDFYTAYIENDTSLYINLMYKIKEGFGYKHFLEMLIKFTIRGIYILNGVEIDGITEEELTSYLKLFKRFSLEEICYILTKVKELDKGDIEVNLMSFIYNKQFPIIESEGNVALKGEVDILSAEKESSLRNSNLQFLESAKLANGEKSLKSELDMVGFKDVKSLFSLEKVLK